MSSLKTKAVHSWIMIACCCVECRLRDRCGIDKEKTGSGKPIIKDFIASAEECFNFVYYFCKDMFRKGADIICMTHFQSKFLI